MAFVNFATRRARSFPLRIMVSIAFIVNCTRGSLPPLSLSIFLETRLNAQRGIAPSLPALPALKGFQPLFTSEEKARNFSPLSSRLPLVQESYVYPPAGST